MMSFGAVGDEQKGVPGTFCWGEWVPNCVETRL